jgi:hypothetical protein
MWWVELLNSFVSVLDSGGAGGGGAAFESIATATGTGSSGTITFSSIPSTYTHLQIRGIGRTTTAATGFDDLLVRFNSDSSASYTYHALTGDGSTASAFGGTAQTSAVIVDGLYRNNVTANTMTGLIIDLADYAVTTKNKTLRTFNGGDVNGSGKIYLQSHLWINTAAVSSITLVASGTNFGTQSVFSLYGIKGA